jgi:ketosteroid isomerase-like protein
MQRVLIVSFLLSTSIIFFSCSSKGEDPEKMITAAKDLDKRFIEAYNNRDIDALMNTYWNSPDLVSYTPGQLEIKGWQNVKDVFTEELANMPAFSLQITESNYQLAGNVVIGWGKWQMTISPPGVEPMVIVGRYTDVKEERNGKWVYTLDHASAPMPPPAE